MRLPVALLLPVLLVLPSPRGVGPAEDDHHRQLPEHPVLRMVIHGFKAELAAQGYAEGGDVSTTTSM
jgi:hypothetical protein